MSDLQEDYSFQCPYCASMISTLVDPSGGDEQSFTIDCEVCCRPIVITLTLEEGGVADFNAEREQS